MPKTNTNINLFVFHLGIAINKDGVVYFADGANIRVIELDGTIRTMIGSQGQPTHFSPLPCESEISIHDVSILTYYFKKNNTRCNT